MVTRHTGRGDGYSDVSQKTFTGELVRNICGISKQSVPLRIGLKLKEFDEDEGEITGRSTCMSVVSCSYQYRRVQTSQMQCELLRDSVQL